MASFNQNNPRYGFPKLNNDPQNLEQIFGTDRPAESEALQPPLIDPILALMSGATGSSMALREIMTGQSNRYQVLRMLWEILSQMPKEPK